MAASEGRLGKLHELVAEALAEQVEGYEEPIIDAEGEVKGTVKVRPSPAVLGAAIAFLKNNNITADPEGNAELKKLGDALAARRKKELPRSALDEAAAQYAQSVGAGMLMQ